MSLKSIYSEYNKTDYECNQLIKAHEDYKKDIDGNVTFGVFILMLNDGMYKPKVQNIILKTFNKLISIIYKMFAKCA